MPKISTPSPIEQPLIDVRTSKENDMKKDKAVYSVIIFYRANQLSVRQSSLCCSSLAIPRKRFVAVFAYNSPALMYVSGVVFYCIDS